MYYTFSGIADRMLSSEIGKEDLATLAGKTTETAGPNSKYEYSYE